MEGYPKEKEFYPGEDIFPALQLDFLMHRGDEELLASERVRDIFGKTDWGGHGTGNDFRGSGYRHGFWSKMININGCQVRATYMLGFGENYVVFLPSGAIIFRFLDEHDLDVSELIQTVERVVSSCR